MSAALSHEFVDAIPERPQSGTLYISILYRTALHLCCCGCGREVVTPITPDDWSLTYNGATVSLSPSIGNWSFECRSHYFITRDRVRWAATWSDAMVTASRSGYEQLPHNNPRARTSTGSAGRGVVARLRAAAGRMIRGIR